MGKINVKVLFFLLATIISFFLYVYSPNYYDYDWCVCCMLIYVMTFLYLLRIKKKRNYFDFENIFLVSCFFIYFSYPCFVYPINPQMFFMFDFAFNHDIITKSTSLALLGLECFILGSVYVYTKYGEKYNCENITIFKTKKLIFILFLFFIVFFATTYEFFLSSSSYEGENLPGVSVYISVIYLSLLTNCIVLEFRNLYVSKKENVSYSISKWLIFIALFTVLAYLHSGGRSVPIYIVFSILTCYSIYYKPFGIKRFLISLMVGASVLSFIGMTRSVSLDENTDFRGDNPILKMTMDLVINARTLYVCVDYVQNNGIFYGKTMLVTFLSFIPFSQRILLALDIIDTSEASSGMFFTALDFSKESTFGVGSNIIADIFLSLGLFGVIVLMFILGYFQMLCQYFFYRKNMKWVLCYVVLISYSLYMSRGEYFYPLKHIFWTILVFLIVYSLKKNINKNE